MSHFMGVGIFRIGLTGLILIKEAAMCNKNLRLKSPFKVNIPIECMLTLTLPFFFFWGGGDRYLKSDF